MSRFVASLVLSVAVAVAGAAGPAHAAQQASAAKVRALEQRVAALDQLHERDVARLEERVTQIDKKRTPNSWLAFASGAAVAVLSLVLKGIWDGRKEHREREERDKLLVDVCKNELDALKVMADDNRTLVQDELDQLDTDQDSVAPLTALALPALERLWDDPPRELAERDSVLTDLSDLMGSAARANDFSKRRDTFAGSASERRVMLLKKIDAALLGQLGTVSSGAAALHTTLRIGS